MRWYGALTSVLIAMGFCAVTAFANPSMLPEHPGYPAGKDTSPVTGQALANDPGRLNLSVDESSRQAAVAEDAHVTQRLSGEGDERILERRGAGQLPKVEGPDIRIDPPVKEGTRMSQPADPKE